jgi:metal-dependent amidase/aminoacylase/carboxypeptidase family protein
VPRTPTIARRCCSASTPGATSYATVAKQIWGFAEVGYQEEKSSALLQQQLRAAGFQVKAGVADIPPRSWRRSAPANRSSASSASSTRCRVCRRKHRPAARHAIEENAAGTAAATTCSAPVRSRRQSP